MLRTVVLCIFLVANSPLCVASEETNEASAVAQAAALMKSWQGDPRILDEVQGILEHELNTHPDSAPALREQARLLMLHGYEAGNTYTAGSLEAAAKSLDKAIALDPTDPRAYLLREVIYAKLKRYEDAWAALDQAKKAGADQRGWLLAQGSLLSRQGRYEESAGPLRQVLKDRNATADQRSEARTHLIAYLLDGNKAIEADAVYRDQLKDTPNDAWSHGNYANFLLCWRDDYDAALSHVTTARQLMDYGQARLTEAAALIRRWAQQALDGRVIDAEKTWKHTGASQDDNPALLVYELCGGNRVPHAVLKAMLKSGNGLRIPALAAVLVAADNASQKIPGVFVMMVKATGRKDGDVFLNSETDYRDQRNLTVRILPKAQDELRERYGEDFETAFKGKPIEVMGWVTRTKIDFRAGGTATGLFYYQTHVIVYSADQIQRFEDKPKPLDQRDKLDKQDLKT